jgi:hypothetical protein
VRKLIRRRLARILAFVSTQYMLIAVGTASATMWIANTTSAVIAAKLDSIANALHRIH